MSTVDLIRGFGTRITRAFGMGSRVQVPDDLNAITLQVAKSLIPSMPDTSVNRAFVEGDHFQNGEGWVGPGPTAGDHKYREFLDILEPAFVSKNVINEGCERLMGAVIGWEPRWAWVPRRHDLEENPQTPEEDTAIDELESALTEWWDTRQAHKQLKQMMFKLMWAAQSSWRLYVPSGMTDDAGHLNVSNIKDALSKIFLEIPEPEDATVWEHPDTKQRVGVVVYQDSKGTEKAEICYLNNDQTVVKILPSASVSVGSNDFGGHLTIFTVKLDKPLITAQVRSLNMALNMTLTLLEKGLVDNHFLEKLFTNTLPPGHWTYEADGKTRKAFIPSGRTTGGRTDSFLRGLDYQDEDGKTHITTPGVHIRNPLDPNGTIGGAEYWYQALLEELRQDHILINELATPSGKSREHSRGDFIDSTKDPVMQADLAGRELLLTLVCMVEAFLGSPGKWTKKFKPVFKCRPNYGPLSTAERQQNIVEAEKGFLSDETVMALNGVDDVDAEQSLIHAQPRAFLALSKLRADAVNAWSLDFPREVALSLAGYTTEEITEIMKLVRKATSLDPMEEPPEGGPAPAPAPRGPGSGSRTNGQRTPTATRSLPPAGNRPSTAASESAKRG